MVVGLIEAMKAVEGRGGRVGVLLVVRDAPERGMRARSLAEWGRTFV